MNPSGNSTNSIPVKNSSHSIPSENKKRFILNISILFRFMRVVVSSCTPPI